MQGCHGQPEGGQAQRQEETRRQRTTGCQANHHHILRRHQEVAGREVGADGVESL